MIVFSRFFKWSLNVILEQAVSDVLNLLRDLVGSTCEALGFLAPYIFDISCIIVLPEDLQDLRFQRQKINSSNKTPKSKRAECIKILRGSLRT